MKYSVEFSCGHTEEVQIYGKERLDTLEKVGFAMNAIKRK